MKRTKPEEWKFQKRWSDIHGDGFIEAICAHGIGHHKGVHGCDGCCVNVPIGIWKLVTNEE